MYNWSTDTTELSKNKRKFKLWKMEQMINFGLDGGKLNKADLIKYWNELNIDPQKRETLSFLLWPKQS